MNNIYSAYECCKFFFFIQCTITYFMVCSYSCFLFNYQLVERELEGGCNTTVGSIATKPGLSSVLNLTVIQLNIVGLFPFFVEFSKHFLQFPLLSMYILCIYCNIVLYILYQCNIHWKKTNRQKVQHKKKKQSHDIYARAITQKIIFSK